LNRLQGMELFVATARFGSFSEAARRAGLSPASVSRIIGDFEARLRVQLFNRTSRTLALTEAGAAYLRRIEPILDGIRMADAEVGAFQARPTGRLRVHSRLMFGNRVLAPLIPAFQKLNPELTVELILAERHADLSNHDSAIDVEIRIGRASDPALASEIILNSEGVLVASLAYLDAAPPLVTPADLNAHRCLVYQIGSEEPVWRFARDGMMEEIGVRAITATNSGEVLRALALDGHGIALLHDYTVQSDIERGRLRRLLPHLTVTNSSFQFGRGIHAVYRRTDYVPAKIRAFVDFFTAERVRSQLREERLEPPRQVEDCC
jgi:DNA-binding transcriptional LysR family regulator